MFTRRVLPSFCLVFCQLPPNVADKSVAYKKAYISFAQCDMVITPFFFQQSISVTFKGKLIQIWQSTDIFVFT